jgi:membrane protein YqaA with SNARE-associated domain
MKLFSRLYDKVLHWSVHRHAIWYLAGLSFAESSFFPVPPDVMLMPMALAQRHKAWYFAALTTVASVCGGVLGYLIGWLAFDSVEPWIQQWGYADTYQQARNWFDHWGVWVVFLAGFTPIPYKIFTISAGVAGMAFIPFMLASLVGRGARFFIVAGLIVFGGEKMEGLLRQYIDRLGWLVIGLLLVAYVVYRNHS